METRFKLQFYPTPTSIQISIRKSRSRQIRRPPTLNLYQVKYVCSVHTKHRHHHFSIHAHMRFYDVLSFNTLHMRCQSLTTLSSDIQILVLRCIRDTRELIFNLLYVRRRRPCAKCGTRFTAAIRRKNTQKNNINERTRLDLAQVFDYCLIFLLE